MQVYLCGIAVRKSMRCLWLLRKACELLILLVVSSCIAFSKLSDNRDDRLGVFLEPQPLRLQHPRRTRRGGVELNVLRRPRSSMDLRKEDDQRLLPGKPWTQRISFRHSGMLLSSEPLRQMTSNIRVLRFNCSQDVISHLPNAASVDAPRRHGINRDSHRCS